MKSLSNGIAQPVLLLAILCFYTWSFVHEISVLRHWKTILEDLAASNSSLILKTADGIDISGARRVPPFFGAKRMLVFLLRYDTLSADLAFWNRVSMLLKPHNEVALVGYCDGQRCAETVRKRSSLPFVVLAYGEADGCQAVVNADDKGSAILEDGIHPGGSMVSWRRPGLSPEQIVNGVVQ